MNQSKDKESIIWKASHEVLLTYLNLLRTEGWGITSFKSWDMIKWNAVGPRVFISLKSLESFLSNSLLKKSTKAAAIDAQKGPKNSRCFVAEHMFPTKVLQDFVYTEYRNRFPTFAEFEIVFQSLNCLCYVWYEEDLALKASGLNSSICAREEEFNYSDFYSVEMTKDEAKKGLRRLLLQRYGNCSPAIQAVETCHSDGQKLFRHLEQARSDGISLSELLMEVAI